MLKKLIVVAFILVFANQHSAFAELTPLQTKAREIFQSVKAEKAVEDETTESAVNKEEELVNNESIKAVEDEEESLEVSEENKPADEIKTAAEAASNSRTAVINKKWSVEALGWNTELTGHINVAKNKEALALAGNNGRIDLESDTSLDKKKVPGLKLSYRHGGRSTIEFNWANVEQDGHLNNGLQKEFNGKVYGADANFKINNAMYDLLWKYRFSHKVEESGREKSYVAGLFGIKASDMEFTFDGNATENGNPIGNHHEDESEVIPVPYIGVEAGTYLSDNLYLKGYIRYLKLNNIKDYDAEHCDYDISLSYKLSNKDCDQDIFFDIGYRQVVYDVEGDGKDVELKYKGPYFGLEFLF